MEELKKLLLKEVEERELIREGLRRVKSRQTTLIVIGCLILIMFIFNFFQSREQIQRGKQVETMLNDVVHAAKLIIEAQDAETDSLIKLLPQK